MLVRQATQQQDDPDTDAWKAGNPLIDSFGTAGLKARAIGRASCLAGIVIRFGGCGHSIWNAGDLAQWVRKEAVKSGCDPASVKLAEWYVTRDGSDVWPVHCVSARTGQPIKLDIAIDKVWKPSQ